MDSIPMVQEKLLDRLAKNQLLAHTSQSDEIKAVSAEFAQIGYIHRTHLTTFKTTQLSDQVVAITFKTKQLLDQVVAIHLSNNFAISLIIYLIKKKVNNI